MRTKRTIKSILLLLLAGLLLGQVNAQNGTQSKLLPISSGEVLNFYNTIQPLITQLPFDETVTNIPVHNEEDIIDLICIDESGEIDCHNYVGQHPIFCQAIVYDKNGDVRFHIVDNNIYNRHGKGFQISANQELLYDPGSYYYLHQGYPVNSYWNHTSTDADYALCTGPYLNRSHFTGLNPIVGNDQSLALAPEILIVPVPESCNEYFVIYGTMVVTAEPGGDPTYTNMCYRKLTYIDENTIEMDKPTRFNNIPNAYCYNHQRSCMAITEYRPEASEQNYLLFLQMAGEIHIYEVTEAGVVISTRKTISDGSEQTTSLGFSKPEMEVVRIDNHYLLAYPLSGGSPKYSLMRFDYDFDDIDNYTSTASYENHYNNSPYSDDSWYIEIPNVTGMPIGLEFADDANKLFFTFEGQDHFYFANLSPIHDLINPGSPIIDTANIASVQASFYQYSQIEMGADLKLYYQGDDDAQNPTFSLLKLDPQNNLLDQVIPLSMPLYKQLDFPALLFSYGKQYTFMDQIDGWDYSGFVSSDPEGFCCDIIHSWPEVLQANESWSPGYWNNPFHSVTGVIYLDEDVTIPKNVNLDIQNMTFKFSQHKKIHMMSGAIGETGAKLNLTNTTLTSIDDGCGTEQLWWGIEMYGPGKDVPQGNINNTRHPVFIVDNSVLENARDAIAIRYGGIVQCENSDFINNKRSISFYKFHNISPVSGQVVDNLSYFNYCDFSVNEDFITAYNNDKFKNHVTMWAVEGIDYSACNFSHSQMSNTFTSESYNKAIASLDAGFRLVGDCDATIQHGEPCPELDLTPTTFTGFYIAVNPQASLNGGFAHVLIDQCVFNNNVKGVEVEAQDGVDIYRSKFNNIGLPFTTGSPGKPIGINLVDADGYRVEENEISEGGGTTSETVGIVINNSGENNNEIYKNTITDLWYAINAPGKNRHETWDMSGLQLLCNIMINSDKRDIDIAPHANSPLNFNGIREYQGYKGQGNNNISAGNEFTTVHAGFEAHLNNTSGNSFFYYYDTQVASRIPDPAYISSNIYEEEVSIANTCLSKIFGSYMDLKPQKEAEITGAYASSETAYWNLYYNYKQLVDGGNTPALLQEIQNTWPQEALDLRDELIAISPFVTEDPLMEAAYLGILPDAILLEVCLANPDATRREEFLDALKNDIPNPLPVYMVEMIKDNRGTETARTIIENGLAEYGAERDFYFKVLVSNERAKTEKNYETLEQLFCQRDNLSDRYSLVDLFIEKEEFTNATNELDQIPNDFELTDRQLNEHSDYSSFLSLMEILSSSSRTILDITPSEKIILENIVNYGTGKISVKVQNILCFVFEDCATFSANISPIYTPKASSGNLSPQSLLNEFYNKANTTPNPAVEYCKIEWDLPTLKSQANLNIYNMQGQLSKSQPVKEMVGSYIWDTQSVKAGSYFYEIAIKDVILVKGKIIVAN